MSVERLRLPTEVFASIMKKVSMCSALVGADVTNPNFRVNFVTRFVIVCIVGYFVFSINTIIELYAEKPTFVLEASCMLGSVLQGVAKLGTGILRSKEMFSTVSELEALYAEYQVKGRDYRVVLSKSCKRLNKIIQVVGIIYFLSVIGIVSVPFIFTLLDGKRHLMMHFLIPGLDVTTTFGYVVTMLAHSACIFCGAFGLFAGDLFVLIFLSHCYVFVDILILKIQELNAYTEDSEVVKALECDAMLKDIIKWHQKYTRFNKVCNNIFYVVITLQVSTSGISIVCTLFILLTGDWPGVYAYIWLPVESLYIYCFLGTGIETCNDIFLCEIYNMKWYNLSPTQQEMVSIMLLKSQHPATIKVAGVMPLSVNTALQISKSIYSIFMMMVRFLGD